MTSVYTHYSPNEDSFLIGSSKTYTMIPIIFGQMKIRVGETIVDSRLRNKGGNKSNSLQVTSGLLDVAYDSDNKVLCAHTNTYNFRMLIDHSVLRPHNLKKKIAWTDSKIVCNAKINSILENSTKSVKNEIPEWAGFHLFSRWKYCDKKEKKRQLHYIEIFTIVNNDKCCQRIYVRSCKKYLKFLH